MRLNLGAGSQPREGYVNVDTVQQDGIDVVWDLNKVPWCWEDNSVTAIEAFDIFEHVDDPIAFMTECHRILKLGKYLHIHTGYYLNPDSFTDPTHKRFPTENTFDYWCKGTYLKERYGKAYGDVTFEKTDLHVGPDKYLDVTLKKLAG